MNENRGRGTSSGQMLKAARGALYVWPFAASLHYAKALAKHLGRGDLHIVAASIFEGGAAALRGVRYPQIVLDHATYLSREQRYGYEDALCRLAAPQRSNAS